MGYWSKREEEKKGQGEKEEMTFPRLRTNRELKHATQWANMTLRISNCGRLNSTFYTKGSISEMLQGIVHLPSLVPD